MDEYTKNIIYYMNNTKFAGTLQEYTQRIYYKSKICGDTVILFIVLNDKTIIDIKYELNGCGLNTASFEIFCEYLLNKKVNETKKLNHSIIVEKLGVYPQGKDHCITLALDVFELVES
jgi:NifU-like protein involved in Fe-S cluster formation